MLSCEASAPGRMCMLQDWSEEIRKSSLVTSARFSSLKTKVARRHWHDRPTAVVRQPCTFSSLHWHNRYESHAPCDFELMHGSSALWSDCSTMLIYSLRQLWSFETRSSDVSLSRLSRHSDEANEKREICPRTAPYKSSSDALLTSDSAITVSHHDSRQYHV